MADSLGVSESATCGGMSMRKLAGSGRKRPTQQQQPQQRSEKSRRRRKGKHPNEEERLPLWTATADEQHSLAQALPSEGARMQPKDRTIARDRFADYSAASTFLRRLLIFYQWASIGEILDRADWAWSEENRGRCQDQHEPPAQQQYCSWSQLTRVAAVFRKEPGPEPAPRR